MQELLTLSLALPLEGRGQEANSGWRGEGRGGTPKQAAKAALREADEGEETSPLPERGTLALALSLSGLISNVAGH
jgi:hypothetical protein